MSRCRVCSTCDHWGKGGWGQFQVGYCPGDSHPHTQNDFCSRHTFNKEIWDTIQHLRQLGISMKESKNAAVYAKGDKRLAVAYAKARTLAVATPGMNFEERVQHFYNLEQ